MTAAGLVFVTGATGFIGSRLVEELRRSGCAVRALVRPTSDRHGVEGNGVTCVEGDVLDRDSLLRGMAGCDRVFHLAAYARNWARDPRVFHDINVVGTRNVLDAVARAGVKRIVLTSTIVTLGPTRRGEVGDEGMARATERFFTEYEATKTEAEREAMARVSAGLPVVIVNPGRVVGPGRMTEGNSVSLMLDLYRRGRFPFLLAGGRNVANYVLVDDLVRGHLLAMEHGRLGERYILGGDNVSLRGLFDLVDAADGRRRLRIPLPPVLARGYAHLERARARVFGAYPQITPGWVETFLVDWRFSSAKATRELGYQPMSLAEGVRMTLRWLDERRRHTGGRA